jgi:4-hydroxyphenylpyruvate dioxygenase-like putative hemolysin
MTTDTNETLGAHFSGIDHIEINVNDMETMANFLKKVGFVETRRTGHTDGSIELRFPGGPDAPILELNQSMNEPKGFQHLALRAKDIEAAFAEVQKSGLKLLRPLGPALSSGRRVFNIEDPQGNKLQVSTKID